MFSTNLTDVQLGVFGGVLNLFVVTHLGGGLSRWVLDASGGFRLEESSAWAPGMRHREAPEIVLLEGAGGTSLLTPGILGAVDMGRILGSRGEIGSLDRALADAPLPEDVVNMARLTTGAGIDCVATTRAGDTQITLWRVSAAGEFTQMAATIRQPQPEGAQVDSLLVVRINGAVVVVSTSLGGNYVATHRVQDDGTLAPGEYLSSEQGTGFNQPRDVVHAEVGGRHFLVVSSAQSSSLTVVSISADGRMMPVDHVIDERTTRFQNVTALESITIDGRSFIIAGGADDGLTLLTLTADGQLIHLATIADTAQLALADVSSISAAVIDGRIVVVAASATEHAFSQFVIDPGAIGRTGRVGAGVQDGTAQGDLLQGSDGTTVIRGGAGDDILIAGTQSIALWGGEGADLFVATDPGGRIAVRDFDITEDRLDLSLLGMIRSTAQLVFRPQSYGMKIFYNDTVIDIFSVDGTTLLPHQFTDAMFPIAHYTPPQLPVRIVGTIGADTLVAPPPGATIEGSGSNDTIIGSAAPDALHGGAGDDILRGGGGDDLLAGNTGDDVLHGDDGADTLLGGDGSDTLFGDAGDDRLFGERGDDLLTAGAGNDWLEGGEGADTLHGGDGDDSLYGQGGDDFSDGGAGNDLIIDQGGSNHLAGGAGNDSLVSGAGNDTLIGGEGDDQLTGGAGADSLSGGDGRDSLNGGPGPDTLRGSAGDDQIYGGTEDDWLFGDDGADTLNAAAGNDTLHGGAGDDMLSGESGNDVLRGEGGADSLIGGDGDDLLFGGDGGDLLVGGAGADTLFGDDGDDTIQGGDGADLIHDGAGNDVVDAGAGDDTVFGKDGDDTLDGGAGHDVLWGGLGHDFLLGGDGEDWLSGDGGDDWIDGGAGADTLHGGWGRDTLFGGQGADLLDAGHGDDRLIGGGAGGMDTLIGGGGADEFVLLPDSGGPVFMRVQDFTRGTDRVGFDMDGLTFIGDAAFSGAGQVRWMRYDDLAGGGVLLIADLDGDRVADMGIYLEGLDSLSFGDLLTLPPDDLLL
ncbi:calcium-binding protein [Paracoccus sp. Z118]|uniref:calcium-binding protein n=1 Tax=Paracoccus sp. Z118 TaxID=2851017 RepID=UPI0035302B30